MKELKLKREFTSLIHSDLFFILILLSFNIFLAFYFFKTIPFGDTSSYAHMTKIIVEEHSIYQQNFYSYFSILLSIVNIPAYIIFRNEFFSIRITTMIIHILFAPVFFLLFRRILGSFSKLVSLLVLFSPWFIYYSCLFSFAEGLTALMVIFAFYFFFKDRYNLKDYLGFSIFSGLALLARSAYLVFIWPFCLFLLYQIYKDHLKGISIKEWFSPSCRIALKKCASLVLIVLPLIIWTIITSIIIKGAGSHATNYFTFFKQIVIDSGQIFNLVFLFKNFLVIIFLAIPLLFGPALIFIFLMNKKLKLNQFSVTMFAFVFLIFFHTIWAVGIDPLMQLRYFLPYFAVGLVAIFLHIRKNLNSLKIKFLGKNFVRNVLVANIAFFLVFMIILNFPYLNTRIISLYPDGYDTITVQSKNIFSMVDWANKNLPHRANVAVLFKERQHSVKMFYFLPDILRDDLNIYVPTTDITFGSYNILKENDSLSGFYIFSNKPDIDLVYNAKLNKIYSSREPPYYSVYHYVEDI